MSAIKVSNLTKSYGQVAVLKDVSLEINSGEFVVFVGPSGCGKSTLLRCISGLEPITDGVLEINGCVVNNVAPSKRGIAMVFQSYALYPHMNVFDNMAYSLKLSGMPKLQIKEKVGAAAVKLELTNYLHRLPKALSGGQRQRVAIGRAIVRDPKVFLFDEPLSNLDAALRVNMRMEISRLSESLESTTMIYVTHDQMEAMTLADRIVVLKDGEVMQVGTPMELYDSPKSRFVAQFIGSPKMNIIEGSFASQFDAFAVGVRPEHLEIMPPDEAKWHGKVVHTEVLGAESFVHIDIDAQELIILRQEGKTTLASGDRIAFSPRANSFHRFDSEGLPLSA